MAVAIPDCGELAVPLLRNMSGSVGSKQADVVVVVATATMAPPSVLPPLTAAAATLDDVDESSMAGWRWWSLAAGTWQS